MLAIRLLVAILLPLAALAESVAFKNFTLIDGTGGRPRSDMAMLITDGVIRWTGAMRDLKSPAGAQVVDLAGKFVMPGLINLHGHVGGTVDLAQDPKFYTRKTSRSSYTRTRLTE
jgi:imidazolonepropionase-like amidohydrolase